MNQPDDQPTPSSLPPSSPPPPFTSDTESEGGVIDELEGIEDLDEGRETDHEGEQDDGEDLFAEDMME